MTRQNPTKSTQPVLLSAAITPFSFTAPAPPVFNTPALLPVAGLTNTTQDPIEVSDILVTGWTSWAAINPPGSFDQYLDVSLRVGRFALTNGFVPISAIAPNRITNNFQGFGQAFGGSIGAAYRWLFARPFILMPGEAVAGAAQVNSNASALGASISNGAVNLRVTVRGRRYVGATPAKRCIPYVTGTWLAQGTPAVEKTFENTFPVPLTVTSMQGAFLANTATKWRIEGPGGLSGANKRTILESALLVAASGGRFAIEEPFVMLPHDWFRVISEGASGQPFCITGFREE